MKAGRIEVYIHSDNSTSNKGGALISVNSTTDFAAKTEDFVLFSKQAAKICFASGETTWDKVILMFPEIEIKRQDLSKKLREIIIVNEISLLSL